MNAKLVSRAAGWAIGISAGLLASSFFWKVQQSANSPFAGFHRPAPAPTLQLGSAESFPATPATFIYRGSPRRVPSSPAPRISFPLREAWRSELLNVGAHTASKGSAAVDGSGIYVGSDAGEFRAYNLDGTLRWKFALLKNKQGFHGTALLDEHFAYVGAYNGRFYKFDKATGKIQWATRVADAVGTAPIFIGGGDLLVSAEKTYRDGFLLRLDSKTGAVKWRSVSFFEQVHSSPTLSPDERLAFVGDNAGKFRAIDTSNGRVVWSTFLGRAIKGTAAWHDGVLYVSSWANALWAVRSEDGKILWRHLLPGISQSSPLLAGEMIVTSSHRPSVLRSLTRGTGVERWTLAISDGREGMASPVLLRDAKGRDLALAQCKTERLCAIDIGSGRIVYEHALPGTITSVPTIANGRVYLTFDRGPLLVLEGAVR